jgi:hypothetical protein
VPEPGDYACVQIPWVRFHGIKVPNLVGYTIRLFTWSKYDHVFVYVGDGQIVEAQPKGARVSLLSEYNGDQLEWSHDDLTAEQRTEICAVALGYAVAKVPYGFLDIAYLGLARLGFRPAWLLSQVEREDRLICSQLVALCGVRAGVTAWLCGWVNACLVKPSDLSRRIR